MHVLRPFQETAYQSLISENHTVLIAPTGSGKSLIFQTYLKNFAASTRALFISPLNALARQHASGFQSLGLKVSLGVGSKGEGPPKGAGVWVLNPEKLYGKYFDLAKDWKPNLLIVDEAHCVWEWGKGFRPPFLELLHAASDLQIEKTFWCTATLPSGALKQIKESLPTSPRVLGRFALPESLRVTRLKVAPHARLEVLRSLLRDHGHDSGLIFVATRKSSDQLLQYLRYWNMEAVAYHAGMSSEERIALEKQIAKHALNKQAIWIVATSAFGMGMDYPFLKVCVLFEPSFNLLALAQALGRVGRASESGQAYVLWHDNDLARHHWLMETSTRNQARYQQVFDWCQSSDCPRRYLEKYFNEA